MTNQQVHQPNRHGEIETVAIIAIRRKRETLKALLGQQRDKSLADGRGTIANMYAGYIVRVDAGRYDDRLDSYIAEARAELAA